MYRRGVGNVAKGTRLKCIVVDRWGNGEKPELLQDEVACKACPSADRAKFAKRRTLYSSATWVSQSIRAQSFLPTSTAEGFSSAELAREFKSRAELATAPINPLVVRRPDASRGCPGKVDVYTSIAPQKISYLCRCLRSFRSGFLYFFQPVSPLFSSRSLFWRLPVWLSPPAFARLSRLTLQDGKVTARLTTAIRR